MTRRRRGTSRTCRVVAMLALALMLAALYASSHSTVPRPSPATTIVGNPVAATLGQRTKTHGCVAQGA